MTVLRTDDTSVNAVLETTAGTTPADPVLLGIRLRGESLDSASAEAPSTQLSVSRSSPLPTRTAIRNEGSLEVVGAYDPGIELLFEAAFGKAWATNDLNLGDEPRTLTVEKRMATSATPHDHVYRGIIFNGFNVNVQPEQEVTFSFPLIGGAPYSTTGVVIGTGSRTPYLSNPEFNGENAKVTWSGGWSTLDGKCVTAFSLTMDNQSSRTQCIGTPGDKHVTRQKARVTASFTMVNDGNTVADFYLNQTTGTVAISFGDQPSGSNPNTYAFALANAKMTAAPYPTPGTNQDALINIDVEADNLLLQRIPAT